MARKKILKIVSDKKKNTRKVVNFKASEKEKEAIVKKAEKYGANMSEWIRYAAMNFTPKKGDLE